MSSADRVTDDWPALAWEESLWESSTATWGIHADTRMRATIRSAIPPFIAGLTPEPGTDALRLADEASRELSRFDAEMGARVSSFAPVLLRSESASSSQIENLTASARAIFSAELGAKTSRNAELIAANTESMSAALELAEHGGIEAIRRMHEVLMKGQPHHTPGQWRTEAVWIGTRSESPVGAEYIAPSFERVPALMDDLMAFAGRLEIPPIMSVAVAHAQFETIHPFTDGNGRTGRALAQSLLRRRGVTRSVAVPVSAGLLADIEGYHDALTAYRAGRTAPIVTAFANASLRAIQNSRQLVADIDEIVSGWRAKLKVRSDSGAWRLMEVIARRPVITASLAATELGVKTPNVYPPLRALTAAGILKSKAEHRLGPFWRSDEILAAVDAFAERAGRRSAP